MPRPDKGYTAFAGSTVNLAPATAV